jgi:glycosyltransferase involved in cell wall biosynthesis
MKILVNATTLIVGGGIQVGISFIEKAIEDMDKNSEINYCFLVSSQIYKQIGYAQKCKLISFDRSPAHPLYGYKTRKKIRKIEENYKPDFIYSVGFPSYVKFQGIEIGRYTNPWEINTGILPWHLYPRINDRLIVKAGILYRQYWAKKANYIETQTNLAKKGVVQRLKFSKQQVFVIPNTPNKVFIEAGKGVDIEQKQLQVENNIFCLSAAYRHKNLEILPYIAFELKKIFDEFFLVNVTLPSESQIWKNIKQKAVQLGVEKNIKNLGFLTLEKCVDNYKDAKIILLPTQLEVFSATYLEAMAMKVPIVTSDLDFSHDNCDKAATYFEAGSAKEASKKIKKLFVNKKECTKKINAGLAQLATYPDRDDKYQMFIKMVKSLS